MSSITGLEQLRNNRGRNFRPTSIAFIGCGGIGSHTANFTMRFMGSEPGLFAGVHVFLIDGDVIEDNNLRRQEFSRLAVGKMKVEALEGKYSQMHARITSFPEYVTSSNVEDVVKVLGASPIIVLGVDSHADRHVILKGLYDSDPDKMDFIVFMGGNEEYTYTVHTFGRITGIDVGYPNPLIHEPGIANPSGRARGETRCGQAAETEEQPTRTQSMFANVGVALAISSQIAHFVKRREAFGRIDGDIRGSYMLGSEPF